MKPVINNTSFGSIIVDGKTYDYDIIIRLNGQVEKRKKKLSKAVYGTSHTVSLDEIKHIWEKGTEGIIVGTGQYGILEFSEEARQYLDSKNCIVSVSPTPEAFRIWNDEQGSYIGLFHITC
ncbi:MAG: hypothetical protein JSV24_08725 [Bacteroidales bacterium]|nr:MAG: hypothetical protein JSV24_08725 [Bacteroidales bacterium]